MLTIGPRWMVSIAALGLVIFCGTACSSQSSGACVAPEATASPVVGAPRQSISIDGQFWQPCNDTNHSTESPWPSASIAWVQDEAVPLGIIHLKDGAFSGEIKVPAEAVPGAAVLRITAGYYELELPIRVSEP